MAPRVRIPYFPPLQLGIFPVIDGLMDAWQSGRMQRIANPQRNPRRFESYCVLHFWFCSPLAVCKTVTLMRGRSSRRFNSVQNHQIESCLSGLRWHPAKVLGYASSPMGSNPILSAKCCMLTGGLVTGLSRRPSEREMGLDTPMQLQGSISPTSAVNRWT